MPNTAQSVVNKHYEWVWPEGNSRTSSESNLNTRLDLYFVSETGTARPRGPLRELIRSKARRKGHPRKDPAKNVELRMSGQVTKSTPSEKDLPQKCQDIPTAAEIAQYQFSAFFRKKGQGQYYIHLYLNVFRHTYPHATQGSMNKKEAVLRLAIEEPALMHATMSHSALGATVLRAEPSCHDQFYHKGEAIRLVNERIGAIIKRQKASDGIISAVTCLTHFEIRSRSQSCIKDHLKGIEILVASRGGLQKISEGGEVGKAVSWFISWTDFCAAIALNEPLKFEPNIEPSESQRKEQPPYNEFTHRLETNLIKYTELQNIAKETADVYWHLRNLKQIRPAEAAILVEKGQSEVIFEYKIQVETLERRALVLSQTKLQTADLRDGIPNDATLVHVLFGSAALIHILLFLRDSPGSVPLSCILARRMRKMLQVAGVDMEGLKERFVGLMEWVLLMGGLGSLGAPSGDVDLEFFVTAFEKRHAVVGETVAEAGIETGNGIEKNQVVGTALSEFMWLDAYRGPETMGFWDLVEPKR